LSEINKNMDDNKLSNSALEIFQQSVDDYHKYDDINHPINNPESNKITTLGNPVKEENNRAQAPANTVIPQSNPSLSGVI